MLMKSRQAASKARPVTVWLAVLRLPSVQSDILITANFPCEGAEGTKEKGEEGGGGGSEVADSMSGFVESKAALVKGMLRTLRVYDWSLFC